MKHFVWIPLISEEAVLPQTKPDCTQHLLKAPTSLKKKIIKDLLESHNFLKSLKTIQILAARIKPLPNPNLQNATGIITQLFTVNSAYCTFKTRIKLSQLCFAFQPQLLQQPCPPTFFFAPFRYLEQNQALQP